MHFQTACRDRVHGITFKTLEGRFWPQKTRVSGEYRLHKNFDLNAGTSLGSAGDAAMSDLE
jgi:hypothetical protein